MIKTRFKNKLVQTSFSVLLVLAVVMCAGVASAQTTTVILPDRALGEQSNETFRVAWLGDTKTSKDLVFSLDPALPQDAEVTRCELLVVVQRPDGEITGQDVAVIAESNQQIGELHIGGEDTWSIYRTPLRPTFCDPKSKSFKITLESKTPNTNWTYHDGSASDSANQPRLVVTYDSPSRPPAVRSGESTDWKYNDPTSFFSSHLWERPNDETRLANPVSYGGAVYAITGTSNARTLYRMAGAGKVTSWPLDFNITKESYAFVTAWGRLQIITKGAIHSCDLTTLGSPGTTVKVDSTEGAKITVNKGETPAMGPDGSLYFKNVEAEGSIVAYNPALREIWRTDFKATKVSPIALSASGRHAYVLADIAIASGSAANMIALLRIDTATGETVPHEISYKDSEDQVVKPAFKNLFRPTVASKVINNRVVDYVFVAGNEAGEGTLQLVTFKQPNVSRDVTSELVWTRHGWMPRSPVLGVVDGNSLFVIRFRKLKRFNWFDPSKGAYSDEEINENTISSSEDVIGPRSLRLDGNDSVYIYADYADDPEFRYSLYAYSTERGQPGQPGDLHQTSRRNIAMAFNRNLLFTTDGALIGYNSSGVFYDLSPKALEDIDVDKLAAGAVYSAESVAVKPDAGSGLVDGDHVILKGNTITLPKGFKWPLGKTLKLQAMPKMP